MKRVMLSIALVLGLGTTQAREKPPANTSNKVASETTKKEFAFIAPGEGRYLFVINEAFSEDNNAIFKWTPKTANATLIFKSGDEVLDEITVKKTDYIKVNLTKYSSKKSLTWFLTVSESEEVFKGIIDLKTFSPPMSYILSLYED